MCPKFIAEYCIEIHAACKWFDSKFFSKSYTPWHIVLLQSHGDFGTFGVVLRQNILYPEIAIPCYRQIAALYVLVSGFPSVYDSDGRAYHNGWNVYY